MKIGQTSIIYFLSRVVTSILGFIATIYFARLLGADPLGTYYLVLGVVSWLAIAGKVGVSEAVTKRVSEGEEREQYAVAGILFVGILFVILTIGLLIFRPYVNSYIGHTSTVYIFLLLFVTLSWSIISSVLQGLHLVHLQGILSPVRTSSRAVLQISAVAAGLGLTGLFLGYAAGYLLVFTIGGLVIIRNIDAISVPRKRHFQSLFDYAKYAWLGGLQSRMFNYTDVIVLGFFVPSALIGIYSIAWNIAMFLILFSSSMGATVFPEMSELSAQHDPQEVARLVEDVLSYTGFVLIPGFVGGMLLDERLLRIYGDEFTQGTRVLLILIVAALFYAYQNQILTTLNAIDRPDLSFRINALFIVANLALNVVLVYVYGWIGAAVATALSVTISLVVAYYMLKTLINFATPYREIARQWIAALLMGAVVYGILWIENTYRLLGHNAATVVALTGLGATVYFLVLFAISAQFRATIDRNLPVKLPIIST
ncbi:polysaccharide biosynthesis protein [Natrinema pellirubrum DSM 15624]|uniref:Membrane protein involved in the export of O-antigen and teichoic acid n=1 Tax=Natrinema pellirubrum (strain DSM 15624 / CIP 106293 / JCM 10476 / NCIMB 786 / 157) TaxID=797303 RepID=L0JJA0_NATP1|nr:flippase [Natrinema pellirubrum]AGB30908.1 membrane protein involved in the export of O-antigen and teichoic acid [Natrinema pellirubrum DSM 15624]ELY80706.1 polysaccharide biosynthesis protein [Natrinema pellirubrum DSM 15624]